MSALHKPATFIEEVREWVPGADCACFPPLDPSAFHGTASLRLINLSPSGFLACDEGGFAVGDLISLALPGLGSVRAQVARRGEGRLEGRFLDRDFLRLRFLNGLRASDGDPRFVSAMRCGAR